MTTPEGRAVTTKEQSDAVLRSFGIEPYPIFGEAPELREMAEEVVTLRARVAEVERERDDEIARVLRVTERLGTAMGKLETAERRLAAVMQVQADIENALNKAYHSAVAVCCGRPGEECCGSPEPDWDDSSKAIMETLGPIHKRLCAALAAAGDDTTTTEG